MGLITDRRFSGSIYGMVVGHDQKQQSGVRSLLYKKVIASQLMPKIAYCSCYICDEELARRRANWQPAAPRYTKGVLAKYAKLVSSSSFGAVTDLDLF
ncbi:hypothetical protein [Nostoc sp. 'Lobaria pulmonaria (5183) cyanobiont']|uniref:hypothetical protein n=1 Tax=Nostoc sp. 'Lobaria pulmonaria (5183) cyanobiont' TaxID=1618022 RepID=UPI003FA57DD5